MSEAKHTPGPHWYQHGNTIQDGRRLVATLHGSADYINANAAQMLAADELRAVLRETIDALWELVKDERDDPSVGITGWDGLHDLVSRARAVLSKASS